MAALLSAYVANDIANAILKHYARGPALYQRLQEKPLLAWLVSGKKQFPGGNLYVSSPVKGALMSDDTSITLGGGNFFQGYTEDDQLNFDTSQNLLRAEYKWYEAHAGLVITWTELKKDGITINDDNKKSEHADMALTKLTDLLEDRMTDFGESWAIAVNNMLWKDGSQDAKQIPGVLALLPPDATTTGLAGGLNRATYTWWRHRALLNILPSAQNQTLSKALRREQRPLRRYGGRPNKFLAGQQFLDALDMEVSEKGQYTVEGFAKSQTDIGITGIALRGVGTFEYDPTLDDLGMANFCYEFDSRRLKLRDMEGEWNKVVTPARPYQYMVFLKSMTVTGALEMTQANCHEVFSCEAIQL